MKTGQKIKNLVITHGYNATDLSNILFLSKSTIYKWYSGVNVPRIDDFIAIADLLNVKVDDLIVCEEIA